MKIGMEEDMVWYNKGGYWYGSLSVVEREGDPDDRVEKDWDLPRKTEVCSVMTEETVGVGR